MKIMCKWNLLKSRKCSLQLSRKDVELYTGYVCPLLIFTCERRTWLLATVRFISSRGRKLSVKAPRCLCSSYIPPNTIILSFSVQYILYRQASLIFWAHFLVFFFLKSFFPSEIACKARGQLFLLSTSSFQRFSEKSHVSSGPIAQRRRGDCVSWWEGHLSRFLWEVVIGHSPGHLIFPFSEPLEA